MEWSRRRNTVPHTPKGTLAIVVLLVVLYLLYVIIRGMIHGSLLQGRDRVNMVFYGTSPAVISLGLTESISYTMNFDNDYKVKTMGGYGQYKIGSLEKLSGIEKDQDLLRRTFSSVISAHVDYYFIPKNDKIYFSTTEHKSFSPSKMDFLKTLMSPSYKTNASMLDRIYLFFLIARKKKIDVIQLKTNFVTQSEDTKEFNEDDFESYYQGFFYEPSLRDERAEIKLTYTKEYNAARTVARILEGEGIRVVDISETSAVNQGCTIFVDDNIAKKKKNLIFLSGYEMPKSVKYLERIYGCTSEIRHIEDADIVFQMGRKLEEGWK